MINYSSSSSISDFHLARLEFIKRSFPNLNEQQLTAVLATQGPLLLLAGAGSGKTTVIINRIANILKFGHASDSSDIQSHPSSNNHLALLTNYLDNPISPIPDSLYSISQLNPPDPSRILAITFTNKAADELKTRLFDMLGPPALNIWASTFHSACVRILRRHIDVLPHFSSNFTIYDSADSLALIKRILKDLSIDDNVFQPRSLLSSFGYAKSDMLSPSALIDSLAHSHDLFKKKSAEIYLEYAKRLQDANALDFDDLIFFTVKILSDYPDVRNFYQDKFEYILVDEFQDTNSLQFKLISLLAAKSRNICVVGDDDQSIYKFRGATIKNILDFELHYPDARLIRLEQNYRSTANILAASNALISHNTERKGKSLWTNNADGSPLSLYIAANEADEAQFIAARLLDAFSNGATWNSFAILYRMNAQSNQLEFALKQNAIPYKVFGGMKFFDRAEVKDMLSYLCLINNPDDDLRLLRIINNPPRGIGQKTINEISRLASSLNRSLYNIISHARDFDSLSKSAPKLLSFINIIEDSRSMLHLPLDQLYDSLLIRCGYLHMLESKNSPDAPSRIENIMELKSSIISFLTSNSNASLHDFLDTISLYTDLDSLDDSSDFVSLMTVHSSKGLEFPTVFLSGAEDGIFPTLRSIGLPDELEEERRLCYVAMTRAKSNLFFTAAKRRMLFGRTSANNISRFINDIPLSYISVLSHHPNAALDRPSSTRSSHYSSSASASPKTPPPPLRIPTPSVSFKKGDLISHKAFGSGIVLSVLPMGGDALIEIAFDSGSTRRLMRNSAAIHMSLINP